jgi:hypothetical protein
VSHQLGDRELIEDINFRYIRRSKRIVCIGCDCERMVVAGLRAIGGHRLAISARYAG